MNVVSPFMQWIYVFYLTKLADRASKEIAKVSERLSDRLSDAGRRVSQSIRQ